MAKLFEFQAKRLLAEAGIRVPVGRLAESVGEVEAAVREIGGRVVLKPQVLEGGRGRRGLIGFARGPEEAVRESHRLLAADFWGQLPRRLLVEEWVAAEEEWYAAVVTDASTYGGEAWWACFLGGSCLRNGRRGCWRRC